MAVKAPGTGAARLAATASVSDSPANPLTPKPVSAAAALFCCLAECFLGLVDKLLLGCAAAALTGEAGLAGWLSELARLA